MESKTIANIELYSLQDLAEELNTTIGTLQSYGRRGLLKIIKIGPTSYVTQKNLENFLQEQNFALRPRGKKGINKK